MKVCTQQQILNCMDERHVIKNEKVTLDRLRVRQNVLFSNLNLFPNFPLVDALVFKGNSTATSKS